MKTQFSQLALCRELETFDPADLASVQAAFSELEEYPLQQAWLPEPEPDFLPAVAKLGWRGNSLLIFAQLTDGDIFTRATTHNQRFWELGDTFEMFLRPVGQKSYVEFHVTPTNLRLQLRFADDNCIVSARQKGAFQEMLVSEPQFQSHAWIRTDSARWYALAEIPAGAVVEKPRTLAGSRWMFSLCRYEYVRSRKLPVISSTSAHTVPDFHRQDQWSELHFI